MCGVVAVVKDRATVELVDLPCFGRAARLHWRKRRWRCPEETCPNGSWTEEVPSIAAPRLVITDRAGRSATRQVGFWGHSENEVAQELGCDWHTVNDAVIAYGAALVEDPGRFGKVVALGLDEVLIVRRGRLPPPSVHDPARRRGEATAPGHRAGKRCRRAEGLGPRARRAVEAGGPLRHARSVELLSIGLHLGAGARDPDRRPFHPVRLANATLDECRRRVQNEVLGHRGHKRDPLYRARRLLTKAEERLDDAGRERLVGLLRAGDLRAGT